MRESKESKPKKPGFFATVKKDWKGASKFNKIVFITGALGFVFGLTLFICSCACGLGAIPALIGFALFAAGAVVAALVAYKNHKEVNKVETSSILNGAREWLGYNKQPKKA